MSISTGLKEKLTNIAFAVLMVISVFGAMALVNTIVYFMLGSKTYGYIEFVIPLSVFEFMGFALLGLDVFLDTGKNGEDEQ